VFDAGYFGGIGSLIGFLRLGLPRLCARDHSLPRPYFLHPKIKRRSRADYSRVIEVGKEEKRKLVYCS
jgi:hypothetical protein